MSVKLGKGVWYRPDERPPVPKAGGGSVTHPVTVDGRAVGYVGDEREWTGTRLAGRRWWACWREDGDRGARWADFQFRTRTAALAALTERVAA